MPQLTPTRIAEVLSQPIQINRLTIKNRLVMGPMAASAPTDEGRPSAQTVAFFEARARGGVGMIIVGGMVCNQRTLDESRFRPVLRTDVEAFVPDFAKVADAVHAHGVPIIAELSPGFGRMGTPGRGRPIISASPINVVMRSTPLMPLPGGQITTPMPQEATIAEIQAYERDIVDSAERLKRAGFDGIEIAAMMSYFLSSFLSPRTNWRTDQYGGSLENRARVLVNMVRGIRERVGPDFVIGLRIAGNDYMPDGQGPEGFGDIAAEVERAGLDYVALVYGCYEALDRTPDADGANLIDTGDALVVKRKLSIPVLVGGLHDPARGAGAIAEGHGDLVMLARPMLADPDYARKVTAGRADEIVSCDRNGSCFKRMVLGMPVRCTQNSRMGRESRTPGALPPLDRVLKAPVERVALGLMGSKAMMDLAGRFMKSDA
jgi:2,4-dienoyl-CoA reductase (NADPH2)